MLNIIRLFLVPLSAITLFAQADSQHTYTDRQDTQIFAQQMRRTWWHSRRLLSLLQKAHFQPQIVSLVMPDTTNKKNWTAYRQRFINHNRIQAGVAFLDSI